MNHTHSNKRKYMRYGAILLLAVFLLTGGFLLLELWEKHQTDFPEFDAEESVYKFNGVEYIKKGNVDTFLILGLDKFEGSITNESYNNNRQADFLMLLVFDNDQKKCTALHINRDTMVSMNVLGVAGQKIDTVTKQIALAHTYGNGKEVSCRNTADAVSELLMGIKVDHYVSLTMDSVPVINDLLGGIEVTVLDSFAGIDDTLKKGEKVTLQGEHALTYVRTRYGLEDSSNSTRMQRQRQYLNALYAKAQQRVASDENFIVEASVKMADYLVSDRTVNQLQELAKKLSEYELVEIDSFEGDLHKGEELMEFYPDVNSVQEIVFDLFYTKK